jgi:hypothetical protein
MKRVGVGRFVNRTSTGVHENDNAGCETLLWRIGP